MPIHYWKPALGERGLSKSVTTLKRELHRVRSKLHGVPAPSEDDRQLLYGAQQALMWALGYDAATPSSVVRGQRKAG